MKKIFAGIIITWLFSSAAIAQNQPFINEINYFKKLDSITPPPERPILFIGSSSFTNWKDVQQYFPGYPILNRAFGGSSLPHQLLYAEEVIFKYHPKQVVIYCGENDLTGGTHITADSIVARFKRLHSLIRKRLPKTSILYVSMKPSPSRLQYLPVMKEANAQIKKYIRHKKRTAFADVFHPMLNQDGSIKSEIFLADRLHMNKDGYKIWQPVLKPFLKK
jgi:hypothetical protein